MVFLQTQVILRVEISTETVMVILFIVIMFPILEPVKFTFISEV
jgi:hypothetical protein